jgi:hypothetical protein
VTDAERIAALEKALMKWVSVARSFRYRMGSDFVIYRSPPEDHKPKVVTIADLREMEVLLGLD